MTSTMTASSSTISCNHNSNHNSNHNHNRNSNSNSNSNNLLDASSHHTPINPKTEPILPLSPNAIENFPGHHGTSSSCSPSSCHSKKTIASLSEHVAIDILEDVVVRNNNNNNNNSNNNSCHDIPIIDNDIDDDNSTIASFSTCGKAVRFSPMVRVKDTLSRHDMSLKEHYGYWLQEHEFLMIKQRNQTEIQYFEDQQRRKQQHQSLQDDACVGGEDQPMMSFATTDTDRTTNTTTTTTQEPPQSPSDTNTTTNTTTTNTTTTNTTTTTNNDAYCLRGLESGLRNENLRKRSYRFASMEEVFLEQEDQYFADIYDDEAIRRCYFEVTVECRFRAEFRALQDRKEAKQYYYCGDASDPAAVVVVVAAAAEQESPWSSCQESAGRMSCESSSSNSDEEEDDDDGFAIE